MNFKRISAAARATVLAATLVPAASAALVLVTAGTALVLVAVWFLVVIGGLSIVGRGSITTLTLRRHRQNRNAR